MLDDASVPTDRFDDEHWRNLQAPLAEYCYSTNINAVAEDCFCFFFFGGGGGGRGDWGRELGGLGKGCGVGWGSVGV